MKEYKIEKKISKSNNSECFLVKNNKKVYCMKVVSYYQGEREDKNAIETEIKILRKLKNQNYIVNIKDCYFKRMKDKHFHYLVFEWCEMNLSQYLAKTTKNDSLPEIECQQIFKQILSGGKLCHVNLVTHQDLKLENVCINPKTKQIKIIDFGFANHCESEAQMRKIENHKGTPAYCAPEKFGLEKFDGRKADIFSIGVLFYKIISAEFPFGKYSSNLIQLIESICYEKPESLCCSRTLNDLIFKMIKKVPNERPFAITCLQHPWLSESDNNKPKKKGSFF